MNDFKTVKYKISNLLIKFYSKSIKVKKYLLLF